MTVAVKKSQFRFSEVEVATPGLKPYQSDPHGWYEEALAEATALARHHQSLLSKGVVWLINSVAHGGGVAEMLPHHVSLLRDFGIDARWLVYQPGVDGFFSITKRIHNSLHNKASHLSDADWALYDNVSKMCAEDLEYFVGPDDILLVHDLQPLGAAAHYLRRNARPAAWRCHVGYPDVTPIVEAAWRFLTPYADSFDVNVFTAPEYARPIHKGQVFIAPTLNPFSVKNCGPGDLATMFTVLDLSEIGEGKLAVRLQPDDLAQICTLPYFLQVARWDRLKGFDTAINAFVHFCEAIPDNDYHLVFAGPDPRGIADDPQDIDCLDYILSCADEIAPHIRARIRILILSMEDDDVNAAIIGYLQEHAYAVLQMSSQEGYGLSLTEALFKGKPAIVGDAFGLKMQIRNGENGFIVSGPRIAEKTAEHMAILARDKNLAKQIGDRAKTICRSSAAQISQVSKWLRIIVDLKKNLS